MPTLAEFDAARKGQAPAAAAPAEQENPLSRFFGGAMATSPLNPMNLVRAAAHPIDTLGSMVGGPLKNAMKVPGDLADVVTGNRGGGAVAGRMTSALEALKHIGGSVPLIGPAGVDAGEKMGEGDIAGGAGELAGLASGALLPKVAGAAPEAISKVGRGAEAAGSALKGSRMSLGGISVPMTGLGAAEAMFGSHPLMGTAVAATPYALEYGGKGLQKVGGALEGLKRAVTSKPALPEVSDLGSVGELPQEGNLLRPARMSHEVPTEPAGGWDNAPVSRQGLPAGQYDMPESSIAGYSAQDVLDQPGSQAFMDQEFNANKPIANRVFGADLDLLGRPKGATSAPMRPSLAALNPFDAEYPMNDDAPVPDVPEAADLNQDFLTPDPLDPYARLMARSAERFGRSFRPE